MQKVVIARCVKCQSIVAGSVLGGQVSDREVGKLVRTQVQRGRTIEIVEADTTAPVEIRRCQCAPPSDRERT